MLLSVFFVKNVPRFEVNESQLNDQNQSRNSLTNIIVTSNNNKKDFCNSCNPVEVPFDDDNHYILINFRYFNIGEINALKIKENLYAILH